MSKKVTREVAEQEVTKWLDAKRILEFEREDQAAAIDSLICFIQEGVLVLNEDLTFTHNLMVHFGKEDMFKQLNYKFRLNDFDRKSYFKGIKINDLEERTLAWVAALTGQSRGIIAKMDTQDRKVANSIAGFFMC